MSSTYLESTKNRFATNLKKWVTRKIPLHGELQTSYDNFQKPVEVALRILSLPRIIWSLCVILIFSV